MLWTFEPFYTSPVWIVKFNNQMEKYDSMHLPYSHYVGIILHYGVDP